MGNEKYWEDLFDPNEVDQRPYEPSQGFLAGCSTKEAAFVVQQSHDEFKKKFREYLHRCPCCGERAIISPESGEQCDICGWYDEGEEPNDTELNSIGLDEARSRWNSTKKPVQTIKRVGMASFGAPPPPQKI